MLLTARRLFTGKDTDVLDDQVLDIADGRIVDIRPRAAVDAGADLIDLGDATLLPGLIDVHQHLAFDASLDPVAQLDADDDATLLLRMHAAAQRALAVGITTIRDLGDRNYLSLTLRDWFLDGDAVGPRIIASGPPITTVNGHCWFLGGEIDGIDGVREAVREHVARGVDVIKVMASGGNMTPTVPPHESQLGYDELVVALEEAHAAGLRLAVHTHGAQAVADSLAVGADSIEHCTFFSADGVDADPEVLRQLAASTCVVSMTSANLPGDHPIPPAIAQRLDAVRDNFQTLLRAGARMVCSSDAGVGPSKPHTALPYGVSDFLPAMGMTNAEAIRNVTAFAAEVCGIDDRTGTLEVGKDADILAVAGNPLADLAAIHDVVAVFARRLGRDRPVIETERLLLRRWREDDRGPFADLNADPEVMEHFSAPLTRAQSDAFVDRIEAQFDQRGYGLWALEVRATGAFIGFTGLAWQTFPAHFTPALEVGWRLRRTAWGHGYASEAARASLEYGFAQPGIDEIVSMTTRRNERSRRVMERIGMTRDPADDFEHPNVPEGSPIRPHVLYRIRRPAGASAAP